MCTVKHCSYEFYVLEILVNTLKFVLVRFICLDTSLINIAENQ